MNKETKFIAEGIKLILMSTSKRELGMRDAMEIGAWMNKYDEMFPKKEPFGGPITE